MFSYRRYVEELAAELRADAMSQFAFLQGEWAAVFDAAARAEAAVHADPRTACFYARRALELAVAWAYKHDAALKLPYQDNLSALIHEPSFKEAAGEAVFSKARVINTLGNRAVHGHRAIPPDDALVAVRELFHVTYWLARTYGRAARPAPGLAFDAAALPKAAPAPRQTAEQLQRLEASLRERDEKLAALAGRQDRARRGAEAPARRGGRGEAGGSGAAGHARLLRGRDPRLLHRPAAEGGRLAAGPDAGPRVRSQRHAQQPRARASSTTCCGATTASRWRWSKPSARERDARVGQQQAKLYADCLERQFGQRPSSSTPTATSTGSGTTPDYPPRAVQGFYKKAELELAIQRRSTRKPLAAAEINPAIVERYYQTRGIRRIAEAFERDHDRKALLVMATGAGKTRTVIALVRPADALQLGRSACCSSPTAWRW